MHVLKKIMLPTAFSAILFMCPLFSAQSDTIIQQENQNIQQQVQKKQAQLQEHQERLAMLATLENSKDALVKKVAGEYKKLVQTGVKNITAYLDMEKQAAPTLQ